VDRGLALSAGVVTVGQVRTRHVGHLLTLGELCLVAYDAAESFPLAECAVSPEPFDARGHSLVLAAALRAAGPPRSRRRTDGFARR
jgi:hypothetical protein